ncbi:MAG: FAD-dependent oxidoreductase [Candidatus Atabeyarchaeum deiterrae]
MKVAILGGGLTGLTIGYLLNQRGTDIEILEKEEECGGLMRSLVENGFTFDYGGAHILFSKDKEALNFILDLLAENKVANKRNTKILYKERYVKYPFENGLADLPIEENFECLYDFIQNLIRKEKGESRKPRNLREWFYYTFGKGMTEKYMIPYNEKIWKHPTEDISLEWVERIPNPPVEDIVKSSLGIQTEGYTHQLDFFYPIVGGIQSVIRAIEEKLKGHIVKRFQVKSIRKKGNKWIVSSGDSEKEFDKVISTIPIHDIIGVFKNGGISVPATVQRAVRQLKYNSLITVMLGVQNRKLNELHWLYIPEKNALAHRVSFPSNFSPKAASSGKSSVMADITCNYGDRVWSMKDEDLITETIDNLKELRIIDKQDSVCLSKVRRFKYAYVISDLNFEKNIVTTTKYVRRVGIDLVGRFAEFRYFNMDACVRRAMEYTSSLRLQRGMQSKGLS